MINSTKKQLPSGYKQHFSDEEARDIALSLMGSEEHNASIIKILDYFIRLSHGCERMGPSLQHIADKCGVSKRTVQNVKSKLISRGLLDSHKRHYTSCLYSLSPVFENRSFREVLAKYSKTFAFLCLASVIPFRNKITAQQYNQKVIDMKYEAFRSHSDSTGMMPRNYSNIESIPKEYNQSLYNIRPDQVVRPTPESQRGLTPSQSEGNIRARGDDAPPVLCTAPESLSNSGKGLSLPQGGLSKTATRVCLLLKLEGSARFQMADFNDEELSYAEDMMPKYRDTIKDPVKWFKAVCLKYRNGEGRKKPSNFNAAKRSSGGQVDDSRGRMNCSPERSLAYPDRSLAPSKPLPTFLWANERCSEQDEGAIFNPQTNVWYRRIQKPIKANVGNVGTSNESIAQAFSKQSESTSMFNMFKNILLGKENILLGKENILPDKNRSLAAASDNTVVGSKAYTSTDRTYTSTDDSLQNMIDMIKKFRSSNYYSFY